MPFANYSDFDDCIAKNKDKDDPGAYCASIHKTATGKYPSQKEGFREKLARLTEGRARREAAYPEVKVDMVKVKRHDNSPPYLRLVQKVIKDGDGKPYLLGVKDGKAEINSVPMGLGSVFVPEDAILKESYSESVSKDSVVQWMVSKGDNADKAKKKVNAHFDYVMRVYGDENLSVRKVAEIIRSLGTESFSEKKYLTSGDFTTIITLPSQGRKVGDKVRISDEEDLFDDNGKKISNARGVIKSLSGNKAGIRLDDGRTLDNFPVGFLYVDDETARMILKRAGKIRENFREKLSRLAENSNDLDDEELLLFIQNDGDLYRQQFIPTVTNLMKKRAQGTYNSSGAVQAFSYLVEAGAKKYVKEVGVDRSWNAAFPPAVRAAAARELAKQFEAEAGRGKYDYLLPKKYQHKLERLVESFKEGVSSMSKEDLKAALNSKGFKFSLQYHNKNKSGGNFGYRMAWKPYAALYYAGQYNTEGKLYGRIDYGTTRNFQGRIDASENGLVDFLASKFKTIMDEQGSQYESVHSEAMSSSDKQKVKDAMTQAKSLFDISKALKSAGFKTDTVSTNAGYALIIKKGSGSVAVGGKGMFEDGEKPEFEHGSLVMGDYTESFAEHIWALGSKSKVAAALRELDQLKKNHSQVIGDDEYFDALDAAERRARKLLDRLNKKQSPYDEMAYIRIKKESVHSESINTPSAGEWKQVSYAHPYRWRHKKYFNADVEVNNGVLILPDGSKKKFSDDDAAASAAVKWMKSHPLPGKVAGDLLGEAVQNIQDVSGKARIKSWRQTLDNLRVESVHREGFVPKDLPAAMRGLWDAQYAPRWKAIEDVLKTTNPALLKQMKNSGYVRLLMTIDKMQNRGYFNTESFAEGKKRYNVMYNVGKAKYLVSFHDGEKKHNDGGDFFDVKIFHNKDELAKFEKELKSKGYLAEAIAGAGDEERDTLHSEGWNIKDVQQIVDQHQYKKINGTIVDATTANVLLQVYNALNDENKKKFTTMDIRRAADFAWRQVK